MRDNPNIEVCIMRVIFLTLLLGSVCVAGPAGITVLSGEQQVKGLAQVSSLTDSYDSGLVPWDGTLLCDSVTVMGDEGIAAAWSCVGAMYAEVTVVAAGVSFAEVSEAQAIGSWLFRPQGTSLVLESNTYSMFASSWPHEFVHVSIDNSSTGTEVFSYDGAVNGFFPGGSIEGPNKWIFDVDPRHQYSLSLDIYQNARMDHFHYSVSAYCENIVPAPSAALLALTGLTFVRQRRR